MARRVAWRERGLRGLALLALAGGAASLASCGLNDEECLHLPCPMPQAIELHVTAAGGGAVEGVVVKTSGATSGTGFCRPDGTATTCMVPGYGGVLRAPSWLSRPSERTEMTAHKLTPILNVSNLAESFRWFEKLGWEKGWDWGEPPTFGGVCSGSARSSSARVRRAAAARRRQGDIRPDGDETSDKGAWMSIWVDDVDAVHRRCVEQGLEVTWPPTDMPWGVREMHVRHPDGHVFRISRAIGEAQITVPSGITPPFGHDHDPVADEVAVAVGFAARPASLTMRTPRPMRAFLSTMARSMTVSWPMPDRRQAPRLRAVDLLQALVVVGAQDQAVAQLRALPDPAADADHRALDLGAHQDAALGDEGALERAALDLGRGQEARVRCRPAAPRRRSRRAGSGRTAAGWPGSRSGSSRRPPSSRGRRGPARASSPIAFGITWRPKSTSAGSPIARSSASRPKR